MTAQTIADTLRRDMLNGTLSPGDRLHQTDIADRFSVSRIPARDALALLAAQGLVETTPNRGTRVLSLTPEEIKEIFDLRVMLECDCLRRAIANITQQDRLAITKALKLSDIEATGPDWAQGDAMFHETLYRPARRFTQTALIARLRLSCQLHIAPYRTLQDQTPQWLNDHAALADLSIQGSIQEASDRLERHLRDAHKTLRDAMNG